MLLTVSVICNVLHGCVCIHWLATSSSYLAAATTLHACMRRQVKCNRALSVRTVNCHAHDVCSIQAPRRRFRQQLLELAIHYIEEF